MQRFEEHARSLRNQIIFDHIHTAKLTEKPFTQIGEQELTLRRMIIATALGPIPRLPSEETFAGRGVSACATVMDSFTRTSRSLSSVGAHGC